VKAHSLAEDHDARAGRMMSRRRPRRNASVQRCMSHVRRIRGAARGHGAKHSCGLALQPGCTTEPVNSTGLPSRRAAPRDAVASRLDGPRARSTPIFPTFDALHGLWVPWFRQLNAASVIEHAREPNCLPRGLFHIVVPPVVYGATDGAGVRTRRAAVALCGTLTSGRHSLTSGG